MQFNISRIIMSDYTKRKNKKRGQKTSTKDKTNIDLARQVRVDVKPEWMKNMRVVRGLTSHQRRAIRGYMRDVTYSGFKIVSRDLQGLDGFQYKVGERYEHKQDLVLCSSGFHFSPDPLQCLAYAEHHEFLKPYRLLKVSASSTSESDIKCGPDKLCSRHLLVEKEVTDQKEKDELLSGICITAKSIRCYKNGELQNPSPGIYAYYHNGFDGRISLESWENGSGSFLGDDILSKNWPPPAFAPITYDF